MVSTSYREETMPGVRQRQMRRWLIAGVLLSVGGLAQAVSAQEQGGHRARDSSDVAVVRQLEHRFEAAHYAKDRATLGRLFAPERPSVVPRRGWSSSTP